MELVEWLLRVFSSLVFIIAMWYVHTGILLLPQACRFSFLVCPHINHQWQLKYISHILISTYSKAEAIVAKQ